MVSLAEMLAYLFNATQIQIDISILYKKDLYSVCTLNFDEAGLKLFITKCRCSWQNQSNSAKILFNLMGRSENQSG